MFTLFKHIEIEKPKGWALVERTRRWVALSKHDAAEVIGLEYVERNSNAPKRPARQARLAGV
jgi:hypothetical protein